MSYEAPPIRPPSEAASILIRVTRNCPWNCCAFCSTYQGKAFEIRPVEEVKLDIIELRDAEQMIIQAAQREGIDPPALGWRYGLYWVGRPEITAFIGDANSVIMPADHLAEIIRFLYQTFPNLRRVTSYARAQTLAKKPIADLEQLQQAGLSRLHVGLETGDDFLLSWIQKGASSNQMIEGGLKVKQAGISLSEYVILGMGGQQWWQQHALGTANVLNAIDPDFIRLRTLIVVPGTVLGERMQNGEFQLSDPEQVLREERLLIEKLNVHSEIASDHVSNYLGVNGRLPEDKAVMLQAIDKVLEAFDTSPDAARSLLRQERDRRL